MERVDLDDPRCSKADAEFWGDFPEEPGLQRHHSAVTALYRNSEGEWFTIRQGKGASTRGNAPADTKNIDAIHAYILTQNEASEFLDDRLRLLRNELKET